MSERKNRDTTSRREFLARSAGFAAATALAGMTAPAVHAAGSDEIRIALIGCGSRGTGAAANALSVKPGPIRLVAMADVFPNRLQSSLEGLKSQFPNLVDVPEDRRFIGFDAYRKAMDCLKPGDIAIFATPPAFRWVHFGYAIQKGLHVFMEKPVTVDGPTTRRLFQLADEADKKNLKVGVGLMSRHSRALQELAERIRDGQIGEVVLLRGYRMQGPVGFFSSLPKPPDMSELMFQVQRFHSFLWASGGCFSDFYIHIIDHCGWMKGAWPIKAQGLGGRHYRRSPDGPEYVDQNFDSYSVEYQFADGTTFIMDGRCMTGCTDRYSSYAQGTKGLAIISAHGDCGDPSRIYKGPAPERSKLLWESKIKPGEENPYQNEWNDLVDAIRNNKPYNEAKRGAEASLVTSLGRMAAHTGQLVAYDEILHSDHEFAPGLDQLTANSPAPLVPDNKGKYPVPQPGITRKREY
jgi:predicted dehydrogenase